MEEILVQARKAAEEAEVFLVSSETTEVNFEANRLKHLQTKQQTSVALRLIREGRIGYAITTSPDDYQSLIDSALETARFGMAAQFTLPAVDSYPQIEVFCDDVASVPVEAMVDLGEKLVAAVTQHTPDLHCEAEVVRGVVSVRLLNSRGGQAEYRRSHFAFAVEGSLIKDKIGRAHV